MARVAFLLADEFEDTEFRVPFDRVRGEGHEGVIVGVEKGKEVVGKKGVEKVRVEAAAKDVKAEDFDAVVIPGGYSPDRLRTDRDVVAFVRAAGLADKPIAAICHGPSLLVEADLLDGRRVTSWRSVQTDLVNAGAHWEDKEVVVDGNLITSRNPGDAEAFARAILGKVKAPEPA
ncbi:MAG: type 1 glutamine amidotransferase domain-containing protein [Myxococcota bacterium]